MPYAELDDDNNKRIRVTSRYVDRDRMREIPGATWSHKDSLWKIPLGWSACVTLRGVFGAELEVGPRLSEWAGREYAERIAPAEALRELISFTEVGSTPLPPLPATGDVPRRWATRGKERL